MGLVPPLPSVACTRELPCLCRSEVARADLPSAAAAVVFAGDERNGYTEGPRAVATRDGGGMPALGERRVPPMPKADRGCGTEDGEGNSGDE